jgi:hypothetical protein
MTTQTVIPSKPSMDGRFALPRWLINTVEVGAIFLRGVAIFIFGIAPAVASLAAGHWAFRPVDLVTAVIVTLFGIPFLVTYMVIERWLGRKWKAAKDRGERKDADEFRRMKREFDSMRAS